MPARIVDTHIPVPDAPQVLAQRIGVEKRSEVRYHTCLLDDRDGRGDVIHLRNADCFQRPRHTLRRPEPGSLHSKAVPFQNGSMKHLNGHAYFSTPSSTRSSQSNLPAESGSMPESSSASNVDSHESDSEPVYTRSTSFDDPRASQPDICRSPSWSRERERGQKRGKGPDQTELHGASDAARRGRGGYTDQNSFLAYRALRRLSKKPPPAAMETQRLPSALQQPSSDSSLHEDSDRSSRSERRSSFSSIVSFIRSRSSSASRKASQEPRAKPPSHGEVAETPPLNRRLRRGDLADRTANTVYPTQFGEALDRPVTLEPGDQSSRRTSQLSLTPRSSSNTPTDSVQPQLGGDSDCSRSKQGSWQEGTSSTDDITKLTPGSPTKLEAVRKDTPEATLPGSRPSEGPLGRLIEQSKPDSETRDDLGRARNQRGVLAESPSEEAEWRFSHTTSYVTKQRMYQQQQAIKGFQDEIAVTDANLTIYEQQSVYDDTSQSWSSIMKDRPGSSQGPVIAQGTAAYVPHDLIQEMKSTLPSEREKRVVRHIPAKSPRRSCEIQNHRLSTLRRVAEAARQHGELATSDSDPVSVQLVHPHDHTSKRRSSSTKPDNNTERDFPDSSETTSSFRPLAVNFSPDHSPILVAQATTLRNQDRPNTNRSSHSTPIVTSLKTAAHPTTRPSLRRSNSYPSSLHSSTRDAPASPSQLSHPSENFRPKKSTGTRVSFAELPSRSLAIEPSLTYTSSQPTLLGFPSPSSQMLLGTTKYMTMPPRNDDLMLPPRSAKRTSLPLSQLRPNLRKRAGTGPDSTGTKSLAKMFVICCGCKFWHDMPSKLYETMAMPKDGTNKKREKKAGERNPSDAKLNSVNCPWCQHGMSTTCCAGWTTMVYLHERHH